jgi:hypothetical protein
VIVLRDAGGIDGFGPPVSGNFTPAGRGFAGC